ncbi:hypothetical protein PR202_gb07393 [Eleusine coracana subsp. coracana]|uniref:Bifunctional inhibitor/plant lipid transfer protein/seed storage helical domain-containing protein n=1 Tax=Eleusine coracana subsp. coracana TaxID=191504 RepID=A0AAV5EC12_ELECO|nr:hypothetical protein QOZ80_2BG0169800 [Eleusine coracana subsp. coracana]GJN20066.1 hypothetical protein PR202_gb07393 [Eleusine coracana subsp. coracana]
MACERATCLFLALNLLLFAAAVHGSCPSDALRFRVCADVLRDALNVRHPPAPVPFEPCCPLLEGLVDVDAAICLCTVIKAADVVGGINIPVDFAHILNNCGKSWARDFQCP